MPAQCPRRGKSGPGPVGSPNCTSQLQSGTARICLDMHHHQALKQTPARRPTMRFGSTAKVLLKCKLKYYGISECVPGNGSCLTRIKHGMQRRARPLSEPDRRWLTVRVGSTAKVIAECKLKYHRISECGCRHDGPARHDDGARHDGHGGTISPWDGHARR